eukprot:gb/GECG01008447.1/.p1 GENE.gb/GECG01008447.1/~~gb/GECG01008447.1/.p1  ORF type:complete len:718 (+),score=83.88 gb/GECG01008447.1/:1-2154(+)
MAKHGIGIISKTKRASIFQAAKEKGPKELQEQIDSLAMDPDFPGDNKGIINVDRLVQEQVPLLIHTAAHGNAENIRLLMDAYGAKIDVTTRDGNEDSAFHLAARNNYPDAIKTLLQRHQGGAQHRHVARHNKNGQAPIHIAAQHGALVVIDLLVKTYFVDINAHEDNPTRATPLHRAASAGHTRLVKYLHQEGAYINEQDGNGWDALIYASNFGHLEVVEYLVEHMPQSRDKIARDRETGMTALHFAVEQNFLDITKVLANRVKVLPTIERKTSSWHFSTSKPLTPLEVLQQQNPSTDENTKRGSIIAFLEHADRRYATECRKDNNCETPCPSAYVCPLSGTLMLDPVIIEGLKKGTAFDYDSLAAAFSNQNPEYRRKLKECLDDENVNWSTLVEKSEREMDKEIGSWDSLSLQQKVMKLENNFGIELERECPQHCTCPVSGKLMVEPVFLRGNGRTYDRSTLSSIRVGNVRNNYRIAGYENEIPNEDKLENVGLVEEIHHWMDARMMNLLTCTSRKAHPVDRLRSEIQNWLSCPSGLMQEYEYLTTPKIRREHFQFRPFFKYIEQGFDVSMPSVKGTQPYFLWLDLENPRTPRLRWNPSDGATPDSGPKDPQAKQASLLDIHPQKGVVVQKNKLGLRSKSGLNSNIPGETCITLLYCSSAMTLQFGSQEERDWALPKFHNLKNECNSIINEYRDTLTTIILHEELARRVDRYRPGQ